MIALDIGSYQTKITTGQWRGQSFQVGQTVLVPTPPGALADGHIVQGRQLGQYLRTVFMDHRIRKGPVAFTISSSQVIMREIVLPIAPEAQLATMVSYEVAKHFPIRVEDYVTAFQRLEDFGDGEVKKVRLLVAAVPREMEEGYWGLASAVGLRPVCLEIQAVSMARLLSNTTSINGAPVDRNATWAVLDIGHSKLSVSFVRDGKLSLTRTIATGGAGIDHAIALAFDAPLERAQELKHLGSLVAPTDGDESDESARVRETIQTHVDDWVREIQSVFRYHLGQSEGSRIDGILLHGGSAEIGGIVPYLQEAFNRPTRLLGQKSENVSELQPGVSNQFFLASIGALMHAKRGG